MMSFDTLMTRKCQFDSFPGNEGRLTSTSRGFGSVGGLRMILRGESVGVGSDERKLVNEEIGTSRGEFVGQVGNIVVDVDVNFSLSGDGAMIHVLVELDEGDAGSGIPMLKRFRDTKTTTILGEKRKVKVEGT